MGAVCSSNINDEAELAELDKGHCPFMHTAGDMASIAHLHAPSGSIPIEAQQPMIATKNRKLTENEIAEHPLLPQRDGGDEKEFGGEISWRSGKKGDYTKVDAKYLNERIGSWDSPECLEHVVSNLVKTFEMELTKKMDPKQWVSMAPEVFKFRANGNEWVGTDKAVERGSYNVLLSGADESLFDTKMTFDESHDAFHQAFPGGFALEILKIYGSPPEVGFTWRHWGKFEGEFNGQQGDGRDINIIGFGNIKVRIPTEKDPRLRITEVEVFFDLNKFLSELNAKKTDPKTVDSAIIGTVIRV